MSAAYDFFKSKTFWTAVITSIAGAVWIFGFQHRQPTEGEIQILAGLWMAVFVRDTVMKGAEIKAGVREPINKDTKVET